ncbi:MAG TPA: HD-GYP domain-containing protein [Thermodesulfovibrionales bacterium]|nr:HD-GYP domain-containing protein [Thermodesulfovibrionales bacterium]
MKKSIKATELKVGMHVKLPASWFDHPFLRNEFKISSRDQIRKIIDTGFKEVLVDLEDRGVEDKESPEYRDKHPSPPLKWEKDKLVPDELREAVTSNTLAPAEKTAIVYQSSLTIMERLLQDPKAENIREAKEGIAEVVDFILSEDTIAQNLLTITSHDFYTYTHSVNVGVLSIFFSKALFKNSHAHNMHELGAGFFLHDIGKVRIDSSVLDKPRRLTDEEKLQLRRHPYEGYKILKDAEQLTEECRIITIQHHEREDGTGYPEKLRGDDIHIYARICCIVDVYDALTADRPYQKKLKPFDALTLMKKQMLNHFSQDLFEKFVLSLAGSPLTN